jgi:hypothetical protein|tara:strand:+ start:744 stop:977 length:234 start_codon:yes stop_codon:yes gene_type:complete
MKNKYTQQEYFNILNNPQNTFFGLQNRGLSVSKNIHRLDQAHKAMKDFKNTNTSNFIANNTLIQSNPYNPNQAKRRK